MMPTTEQLTVEHYARAELERAILAGLHALGADAAPKPEDLAAVDVSFEGSGSRASAGARTSRLPPYGRYASGCRRAARHRSASIS